MAIARSLQMTVNGNLAQVGDSKHPASPESNQKAIAECDRSANFGKVLVIGRLHQLVAKIEDLTRGPEAPIQLF